MEDRKKFIVLMNIVNTAFMVKTNLYAKTLESAVAMARGLNAQVIGCYNDFGQPMYYKRKRMIKGNVFKKDEDQL